MYVYFSCYDTFLALFLASDYRSWVFYFSLPVLLGVLPEPYFSHYCLLVAAMHILYVEEIRRSDVTRARSYLLRFYEMLPTLYGNSHNRFNVECNIITPGENACTMNVHMLRHLVDCVENWGRLWAYSCFTFESFNGQLKYRFHGTRCMNFQVCSADIMKCTWILTMLLYLYTACIFLLTDASYAKTTPEQSVMVSVSSVYI